MQKSFKKSGDSIEAVRARTSFLEKGYYQPLADELKKMLSQFQISLMVDAGCGEGYYSNQLSNSERCLIGFDLSKSAIDHAAKEAKKRSIVENNAKSTAFFAVSSIFEMPLVDECADAVINLFAPCCESEFNRILKPGGALIVVGAGRSHLMGLKKILYDTPYQNEQRSDLPVKMRLLFKKNLQFDICVKGQDDTEALFSMTPYYYRTSKKDHLRISLLDVLHTEVSFDIFCYGKV